MKMILSMVLVLASQVSFASQRIGADCYNSKYEIAVQPISSKYLAVHLVQSKTRAIVDDNYYLIEKSPKGTIQALSIQAGVKIVVSGLDQENIGRIKITYQNTLLGINERFSTCDIID